MTNNNIDMIVSNSARYELETSLSFSLPTKVGQSDLLLDFWNSSAALETFVYRKTRFGAFTWRIGTTRILSSIERRDICKLGCDRLTVVRALISPTPATESSTFCHEFSSSTSDRRNYTSELKSGLLSDRTVRYDDSLTYEANMRYPLILEDRLSIEIWPLSQSLERDLLLTEHDTSDNNLGLNHEHRLSIYVAICTRCAIMNYVSPPPPSLLSSETLLLQQQQQRRRWLRQQERIRYFCNCNDDTRVRVVRVSLRSSLNEYHEAAYWYELECEEDIIAHRSSDNLESVRLRQNRHDALLAVFNAVSVSSLSRFWPDGLSRERIPSSPCKTLLDSLQTTRIVSGQSSLTHERLFESLIECSNNATRVKLKYDGYRSYGWYAMGNFWIDSASVEIVAELRRLLCGLYIYQLETDFRSNDERCSPSSYVFTEVSFVMDHRAIGVINGGGALARQIEVSEYSGSTEQKDTDTAYVLSAEAVTATAMSSDIWSALVSALRQMNLDRAIESFLLCCSQCAISYVAKTKSTTENHNEAEYITETTNEQDQNQRQQADSNIHIVRFLDSVQTKRRLTIARLTRDYVSSSLLLEQKQKHHLHHNDDDEGLQENECDIAKKYRMNHRHSCSSSLSRSVRRALSQWNNPCGISKDPLESILIPVTIDFSTHVMTKLHNLWYASSKKLAEFSKVAVTATYVIPRDIVSLLRAYRKHNKNTNTFPLDGLLIMKSMDNKAYYYEKMKLRQTIDVFVTRDFSVFCSAEGPFAKRAFNIPTQSTISQYNVWNVWDETIPIHSIRTVGLSAPTCDSGQIAELEFQDLFAEQNLLVVLKFLRWRRDKHTADSALKIRNILLNVNASSLPMSSSSSSSIC